MKKTVIGMVSNRSVEYDTMKCIASMQCSVIAQHGCSDISLTRNIVLSDIVRLNEQNKWDVALLVDDDMVFTREDALTLINHGSPVSASYVLRNTTDIAACTWKTKWLTGLGLIAIPLANLIEVTKNTRSFKDKRGLQCWEFCSSGIEVGKSGNWEDNIWNGEDYSLCKRLGGVDLLPIPVGHIKKRILMPDKDKLIEFVAEMEAKRT